MKDKFFFDLGRVLDDIFAATQNLGHAFKDGFSCSDHQFWDEKVDFYPAYAYPPANVYLTKYKELVFEFALSGFRKEDIGLLFKGDYMILSVKSPHGEDDYKDVRFFKHRLKTKAIVDQKYYVPANRFDRDKVSAIFKNGLLRVVVPPDEDFSTQEGVEINIENDDESAEK
jgi:HSP20 family molecular chaperone IbpA